MSEHACHVTAEGGEFSLAKLRFEEFQVICDVPIMQLLVMCFMTTKFVYLV